MKRFLQVVVLSSVVVAIVAACASSPTGRRQLIMLSDSQLEQMGVAAFAEMKQKQKLDRAPSKQRYVECISTAIAKELGGKYAGQKWEVAVFQDDSPNAFALPGGKIGVHTGMLKIATSPDQLAAVLGHEVGHVIARHSNERASASTLTGLAQQVGGSLLGGSTGGQVAMQVFGMGSQFGILAYSRTHESEADRIGQELMAKAGFDPRASVQLWQNMKKAGDGKAPPEFMSTHPGHDTRISALNKRMNGALAVYQQARASGKRPNCRL